MKKVTYISGGVGGAKFAKGLNRIKNIDLTILVNTGDDEHIHGVFLSPDIDTVIYNLAGIEGEFGWGVKNDKFTVHNELKKFYDMDFRIGDTVAFRKEFHLNDTVYSAGSSVLIDNRILLHKLVLSEQF